jgi:8-oxo-dGTP pyrophosphatase MutT (NUDIX family)
MARKVQNDTNDGIVFSTFNNIADHQKIRTHPADKTDTMRTGYWDRETGCPMHCFSIVVCRHPETKRWLAVEETNDRGWWLPGGFVECGGDFPETAIRETQEEAGIDVSLKGILRIENTMDVHGGRQRVIYYAEPVDPLQSPKTTPDKESVGAAWLTVDQLENKKKEPPPAGLRGKELLHWAKYIEAGGTIYPLEILSTEETPVPTVQQRQN